MCGTTTFLLVFAASAEFFRPSIRTRNLNSASFSGSFRFTSFGQSRATAAFVMAASISVKVNTSSSIGTTDNELEASSTKKIGADDLLIVGPGVLGHIVAGKWREEHPGCQIYGETLTTDHHDELIKMGINPFLYGASSLKAPSPDTPLRSKPRFKGLFAFSFRKPKKG